LVCLLASKTMGLIFTRNQQKQEHFFGNFSIFVFSQNKELNQCILGTHYEKRRL